MKIVCSLLLACGFMSGTAIANDAPASDASILEFLELTNAHQLVDGVKAQVDTMMDAAKQEALKGRALTPERQQVLDHMVEKFRAASADMTNWDALLPMYMQMYRDTFTQDELDGAIAFYKTPAGMAIIKKMPLLMQNLMGSMQGLFKVMRQKILDIQKETVQELQELEDKRRSTQGASTS